jgi:hypothetical protein
MVLMLGNFGDYAGVSTAMMPCLLGLTLPAATWACSCSTGVPPCEAAWKASAVFAGTVVELTRDAMRPDSRGVVQVNGFFGTHAIFELTEDFIGMEGRGKQVEIRTGMGGRDCGYPFQRAESYMVFAYENKEGLLVASICSRTANWTAPSPPWPTYAVCRAAGRSRKVLKLIPALPYPHSRLLPGSGCDYQSL